MKRRGFLVVLGGAAFGAAAARAQQQPKYNIGFLSSAEGWKPGSRLLTEFRKGLAEQGLEEGRDVAIEYRWAAGQYALLAKMASELVEHKVDLIVTPAGSVTLRAAKKVTSTIPIVAMMGGDPVAGGIVESLNRPGGNITGIAQLMSDTDAKRLQLLHELVPASDTIAYLENPTLPFVNQETKRMENTARDLGLKMPVVRATRVADFDEAFTAILKSGAGALLVHADPFFFIQRQLLVDFANQNRLPAMYFFREFVTAGGLISYSTRLDEGYHELGAYVGRVLKGTKPADLPIIQQSEKIELVVNEKTANAIGLTIPQSILVRADEVIE
jgi:putative ABC transport system substrate-binding protein